MEVKRTRKGKLKTKLNVALLTPLNLVEQQALFFSSGCTVDPVFTYREGLNLQAYNDRYKVTDAHLQIAKHILKSCLNDYKTESNFFVVEGGELLDEEQTRSAFADYLAIHGIQGNLEIAFKNDAIAPTAISSSNKNQTITVLVQTPIVYRRGLIPGVLHHEVGTHLIRSMNERQQIWHKRRHRYDLKPYTETEEGLAALNTQMTTVWSKNRKPYMWSAALHYYSNYHSSRLSFVDLYKKLAKYIDDPLKRWRQCVRVKRGRVYTAEPGGCYKDQVYLKGACNILSRRREIDFMTLISGKLTLEDQFRPEIRRRVKKDSLIVPCFMKRLDKYMEALDKIALVNGLGR
mmetsp:Transcript_13636/g.25735  ORF Transcript_13636/g.25735 Transcript_13636/m.25735 type:complete len:347 (+) Transcript_13636:1943-2983(+)